MKILHTSDWHLGRQFHNVSLLDDQRHVLQQIIDYAVSSGVDVVIIAGDIYDRSVPPANAVSVMSEVISQLHQAGIIVIITSGNHDGAERLGFAAGVMASQGVHILSDLSKFCEPIVVNDEPHVVHVIEFGTTVNVIQRMLYGLIWIVLICITLTSFAYAIALMLRFRNGEYFTLTTTRLLRNLGLALMAANVFYNAVPSLTHIILSFRNPHGMYGPVYFYDPSSIALFLAGCGFAILGWVFLVARQIQLENQDFV